MTATGEIQLRPPASNFQKTWYSSTRFSTVSDTSQNSLSYSRAIGGAGNLEDTPPKGVSPELPGQPPNTGGNEPSEKAITTSYQGCVSYADILARFKQLQAQKA